MRRELETAKGASVRNISFALTTDQIRKRTKTVTRRIGWTFLKPGTLLQPVEKCQGLKKGEHVEKIGSAIRAVNVRRERLADITLDDVRKEGFPEMSRGRFIAMFCNHNGCRSGDTVTRIEFEYLEDGQ
jgi:hypothetical protein